MFQGLLFFLKKGWKYDKCYILWNLFLQLVNAPIPLITALLPKLIIDELMVKKRTDWLLLYVGLFAGMLLLIHLLSAFFYRDGFSRRVRVAAEFDNDLHRSLYECDYGNLENARFLELQEKSKKFLYCNWHGFGYLLDCAMNIFGYFIALLGLLTIFASLKPWLVLLFVSTAVLGAVVDGRVQKNIKRMEDSVISDQRKWMYYSGLFERMEYGKEFRLFQAGEWLLQKEREFFTKTNDTIRNQNQEYLKSGIVTAVFTFVEQCAAYGYLIAAVLHEQISIGSFMMYASAVTAFATLVRQIINAVVEIKAYDLYYDNLEEYLSIPTSLRSGTEPIPNTEKHEIRFVNVSFRYPGSPHDALHNINISIWPGEKLLVVGENGAGKTTFIKLLLRLYDPTEGEILLDGVNIKKFDYDSYTALFSTVFQDFNLYAFSLRDNLAMSASAEDEKLWEALQIVGLGEKLKNLPGGLSTEIHKMFEETGYEPSGGEGQRLAIARALYKNAPFVILDEPTAALDPRAEFEIYEQFHGMVQGKTAVYISHRLSSAKFCDRIAVFEGGCITESGSHETLLQSGGKYAELFRMQADFYTY